MFRKIALIVLITGFQSMFSQNSNYISSDSLRNQFPELIEIEQNIQSHIEKWNNELQLIDESIDNIECELKSNIQNFSESEILAKKEELNRLYNLKEIALSAIFGPNGLYDELIKDIMHPVEDKIFEDKNLNK